MTRIAALFLVIIFSVSSSAFAAGTGTGKTALQTPPGDGSGAATAAPAPAPEPGPKDRIKESIHQEFDFEGDVIETEYLRPNSAMVETVKKRSSLSLVRIKTSFLEKILSTVDEL